MKDDPRKHRESLDDMLGLTGSWTPRAFEKPTALLRVVDREARIKNDPASLSGSAV